MLARHYCPDNAALYLIPEHPGVAPISVHDPSRCNVWGVVAGGAQRSESLGCNGVSTKQFARKIEHVVQGIAFNAV